MQPIATAQIVMYPDGRVLCKAEAPSRAFLNGMMVTAHQNLLRKIEEKEEEERRGEAVSVAPPGFKP